MGGHLLIQNWLYSRKPHLTHIPQTWRNLCHHEPILAVSFLIAALYILLFFSFISLMFSLFLIGNSSPTIWKERQRESFRETNFSTSPCSVQKSLKKCTATIPHHPLILFILGSESTLVDIVSLQMKIQGRESQCRLYSRLVVRHKQNSGTLMAEWFANTGEWKYSQTVLSKEFLKTEF